MNDEQLCRQAFDDFYHKIKAEVSYDHWVAIWNFILKRHRKDELVALTMGRQAVAVELLACFQAWEPMVCVLGNVRARDGADLMQAILNAAPQPASPSRGELHPARLSINERIFDAAAEIGRGMD